MIDRSVSMSCSYEQFKSLKLLLDNKGFDHWCDGDFDSPEEGTYLLWDGFAYWFTFNNLGKIHIHFYNPECFLGVVRTDSSTNELSVGEYLYCTWGYLGNGFAYKTGEILRIDEVVDMQANAANIKGSFGLKLPNGSQYWRKATPQEIIHHFEKLDILEKSNKNCVTYKGDHIMTEPPDIMDSDVVLKLIEKVEKLQEENDKLLGIDRQRSGKVKCVTDDEWVIANGGDPKITYNDFLDSLSLPKGNYVTKDFIEDVNKVYPMTPDECYKTEGHKESEGKLDYELDWEFIESMAKRMQSNKGKYEPYNWTKPFDVEKLKQSLMRHTIEIMKGNYEDDGVENAHLFSIALNAMMINYQLKNNKNES